MYRWQGCEWRAITGHACAHRIGHIGWHEAHIRPDSADHPDRLTERDRTIAREQAISLYRYAQHRSAFLGDCGQATCPACHS